jgi:hypothetical protein
LLVVLALDLVRPAALLQALLQLAVLRAQLTKPVHD